MNAKKSLHQTYKIQSLLARAVFAAYGCCLSAFFQDSVSAANAPLPNEIYPYTIIEQDVTVVLREFGQNLGIRVQLSPKVSGVVKGKMAPLQTLDFLNHVCQMNGLEWYFDGSILHITAGSEEVTKFLPLKKPLTPEKLADTLKQLSFYDERYPLRSGPDNASVFVSGPPAYAALVEQTLASSQGDHSAIPTETMIYRGGSVAVQKFEFPAASNNGLRFQSNRHEQFTRRSEQKHNQVAIGLL